MSGSRPFLDTNILIYAVTDQGWKSDIAKTVLVNGGVISVQVLNEFAAVAKRKLGRSWREIDDVSAGFRKSGLQVVPLDVATHSDGLKLAAEAQLHIYDACIVASASRAGCGLLLTEDLQDGRRFGDLVVRNPFAGAADG
ncbi:MAG: PIN domain-containing protein [Brevundimonas sp.]|uniref:PIN domain-containing protein n=1 Tax=Brevundimonas sp. TaxID=1871086 RepID=UPI0025B94B58|nr:PIN domain-containing protein [Brevundimonas sp.]MBX3476087.1 PIN domain-containing protein [Brevundimonas sp.]